MPLFVVAIIKPQINADEWRWSNLLIFRKECVAFNVWFNGKGATGNYYAHFFNKLALSGTQYDTDNWSQLEKIESTVWMPLSGLVVRPVGSPRMVWKGGSGIMSGTGEIDSEPESGHPYIALNPYHGKHKQGEGYRETWIKARNVFVCFSDTKGDQGDLVPTIIFKQVDP